MSESTSMTTKQLVALGVGTLALGGALVVGSVLSPSEPTLSAAAEVAVEDAVPPTPAKLALVRKDVVVNVIVVADEERFRKSASAYLASFDAVVAFHEGEEWPAMGSTYDGRTFTPPKPPAPPADQDGAK